MGLRPPVEKALRLVAAVGEQERALGKVTLGLVLLAIGDSLVGEEVAAGTGQARAAVREIAVRQIGAIVRKERP